MHKLCLNNNCSCYFDVNKLLIQDLPTWRLLYQGLSRNGVYPIHSSTLFNSASNKTACAAHSITPDIWQLWYSRLGHPDSKVLTKDFWETLSHNERERILCIYLYRKMLQDVDYANINIRNVQKQRRRSHMSLMDIYLTLFESVSP